jgi:phosphoglycolate phosphatase
MKYGLFVFDFDYTLADATPGIVASANYALREMGLPQASVEAIRGTVGMSLEDTYAALTGDQSAEAAALFARGFRAKADEVMTDSTTLFSDTVRVLRALREGGGRIAIVTSKYRYRIEQVMEKFGMAGLIDRVIGHEDVGELKPSPEGLLRVIDEVEHAGETLYVGDSVIDAETARRAGVDFVAVTTGATGAQAFEAFPCVKIISALGALLDG